jgi:hypothetical protein
MHIHWYVDVLIALNVVFASPLNISILRNYMGVGVSYCKVQESEGRGGKAKQEMWVFKCIFIAFHNLHTDDIVQFLDQIVFVTCTEYNR